MPRLTGADLVKLTYARLENNTEFYRNDLGDSEVLSAINQGLFIINNLTGTVGGTITVETPSCAGRTIYNTPNNILFPMVVNFDGKKLQKSTPDKLSDYDYRCLIQSVTQTRRQPFQWAAVGLTKFMIYPADNLGGSIISVTGIAEIAKLTLPSQSITLGNETASAIADYAAHIMQSKIGRSPFVDSLKLYKNFQAFVALNKLFEVEDQGAYLASIENQK